MTAVAALPHTPLVPSPGAPGVPVSRWLTVVSHTDPRYGGLSSAVPRAALDVRATGRCDLSLAAFCAPGEEVPPPGFDQTHLSFWPLSRGAWLRSRALREEFDDVVRAADGLHLHGLWEASTMTASRAAIRAGRPYVLSAHGMLEPWALAQKRWKKQIYAAFVERATVRRASCLHALSAAEAAQYRAFGAKAPIAVIPNAVAVPEILSPQLFLEAYPRLANKRIVLYLGRLHPKKGLPLLLEAWEHIAGEHAHAHLVLAGPDNGGTQETLAQMVQQQGLRERVTFTGMLNAEMKWSALAAAEIFVLPSYSEGLSMGVLEALGAGLPVLITNHCHMPEVAALGAGWVAEADATALEVSLREALGNPPESNRTIGERGRRLIANRYHPAQVAIQMAEIYAYVVQGTAPSHVELEHV